MEGLRWYVDACREGYAFYRRSGFEDGGFIGAGFGRCEVSC